MERCFTLFYRFTKGTSNAYFTTHICQLFYDERGEYSRFTKDIRTRRHKPNNAVFSLLSKPFASHLQDAVSFNPLVNLAL